MRKQSVNKGGCIEFRTANGQYGRGPKNPNILQMSFKKDPPSRTKRVEEIKIVKQDNNS